MMTESGEGYWIFGVMGKKEKDGQLGREEFISPEHSRSAFPWVANAIHVRDSPFLWKTFTVENSFDIHKEELLNH